MRISTSAVCVVPQLPGPGATYRHVLGTIDPRSRRIGSSADPPSGALAGHCHDRALMSPPSLPCWFGPRASPDDPAVAALIHRVAAGLDGQTSAVDSTSTCGLTLCRRLSSQFTGPGSAVGESRDCGAFGRLQPTQVRVARPIRIFGCDLLRVADRWAETEEFIDHVQPRGGRGLLRPPIRGARTPSHPPQGSLGAQPARTPRRPQNLRPTALLGGFHVLQGRTPRRAGRASDAPTD